MQSVSSKLFYTSDDPIFQLKTRVKLAIDWELNGEISKDDKDEILFMVTNAAFDDWRPLLYLIPRQIVADRLKVVPIQKRASYGMEYIIEDLQANEFDIIEF